PIEEFRIAVAVKRTGLVGDAGGGLPLFPLPSIDRQHLAAAVALDPPDANDGDERRRFGADRVARQTDRDGLAGRERERRQGKTDDDGGDRRGRVKVGHWSSPC